MKSTRLFTAAFSLLLAFSIVPLPAQAQQSPQAAAVTNHNAGILLEYTLTEGGKVISRSVVHADPQDSNEGTKSSSGTTFLRLPGGGMWTIITSLEFGVKEEGKPQDDYLNVEVNDLQKLQAPSGETNTVLPMMIFGIERRYRGPGTYVLFEDNERKLSVTVTERSAVEKER